MAILTVGDRAGGGVKAFIVFSTATASCCVASTCPKPCGSPHGPDELGQNLIVLTRNKRTTSP